MWTFSDIFVTGGCFLACGGVECDGQHLVKMDDFHSNANFAPGGRPLSPSTENLSLRHSEKRMSTQIKDVCPADRCRCSADQNVCSALQVRNANILNRCLRVPVWLAWRIFGGRGSLTAVAGDRWRSAGVDRWPRALATGDGGEAVNVITYEYMLLKSDGSFVTFREADVAHK